MEKKSELAVSVFMRDGRVFADSRDIAEKFGKRHDNVLAAVDALIKDAPSTLLNFKEGVYTLEKTGKQKHRFFEMTRDGFSLLVMGFTGKRALEWKLLYIEAFNKLEQNLQARRKSLREEGKKARNTLTSTLARHGVNKPDEYRRVTNSTYVGLWGKDAAGIREAKKLPAKANLREHMSEVGLGMVMLSEALTSERIVVTDQQGVEQCSAAATTCASVIRNAVLEERESRKLIGD